ENASALGLEAEFVEELRQQVTAWTSESEAPKRIWESPESMPLLRDLLILAAENRRVSEAPALGRLESDVDHLHEALREQRRTDSERLRPSKRSSLAEFAAGAGHEINNPLAVISGQAKSLLSHEPDPTRQEALQKIVAQTKRIHQILSELMLFARPPK